MRVLLVADIVGGVRTFTLELARALGREGIEVDLALLGAPIDAELERALVAGGAGSWEARELRLEWMDEPWEDVAAAGEWVEELHRRLRPDLVHMNTFTPVLDPAPPVVLTVHSCVLSWWRAVHGRDAPPSWNRYRRLSAAALERADLVVAPSAALLAELERVHGSLPHARVVHNGRDVRPPKRPRERLVLGVGRLWDEAKNAAAIAEAAPAIDGRVALIGEGAVPGVESLGPLPNREVTEWLSRAAVFAGPACYEPFGLGALEAGLCGCALVLGDIPSLREIWGGAATFVAPDDHRTLAETINRLLEDDGRRAAAAAAAGEVARRYSASRMARSYLDAYRELARPRRRALIAG